MNLLDYVVSSKPAIAVIGASNNQEKYGNRIAKNLISKGYKVYPVNHKEDKVLDLKAYKSIDELPTKDLILDFVVPPAITFEIVKHAIDLGFTKFWLQPGSFDSNVVNLLKESKVDYVDDTCIMIATD